MESVEWRRMKSSISSTMRRILNGYSVKMFRGAAQMLGALFKLVSVKGVDMR